MKANMMRTFITATALGTAFVSGTAYAGGYTATYDVTITNLTRGQTFTPSLVVSHRPDQGLLFNTGEPASDDLAALAEGGATAPFIETFGDNPGVRDTSTSEGLLEPGKSVTIQVNARPGRDRISIAAMLIPTNDAFYSFRNLALPRGWRSVSARAPVYDAGSEPNDELCINMPGPVCGGTGPSPGIGGEDFVHIHAGIHGIGDLPAAEFDWRNPAANVVIQRVK